MNIGTGEIKIREYTGRQTIQYNKCLLVSRHKLLPIQEEDIREICKEINVIQNLPTTEPQLRQSLQGYDAVIGSLPLTLQVMIYNDGVVPIIMAMESKGVFTTEQEAIAEADKYNGRAIVLPPSPNDTNKLWRITVYVGLLRILKIDIDEDYIIKH